MPLLEWKDEFQIGIASVDYEHRNLIAMINDLHARLSANAGRDEILDVLGEIHALIAAHFALEEQEMKAMGYGGMAEHKDDHEDLLDQIRDIMDEAEADASGAAMKELGTRLNNWFGDHFRSLDSRLHHFLEGKGG